MRTPGLTQTTRLERTETRYVAISPLLADLVSPKRLDLRELKRAEQIKSLYRLQKSHPNDST